MSALSDAMERRPFANGTEGDAWMDQWCAYCVHHHAMHDPDPQGPGCDIITYLYLSEGHVPEVLVPEPDDGRYSLPSRMVCLKFAACELDGCTGDPGVDDRADRVAEVTAYWRTR